MNRTINTSLQSQAQPKNILPFLLVFTGIMIVGIIAGIIVTTQQTPRGLPKNSLVTPQDSEKVVMELRVPETRIDVGDEFHTDVMLSAGQHEIDGIDIVVTYDPTYIEFNEGSVKPTGSLPQVIKGDSHYQEGVIRFSLLPEPGERPRVVSQNLAQLSFKAVSAGTTRISLDQNRGDSADTNVASAGRDILMEVVPAQIVINE